MASIPSGMVSVLVIGIAFDSKIHVNDNNKSSSCQYTSHSFYMECSVKLKNNRIVIDMCLDSDLIIFPNIS